MTRRWLSLLLALGATLASVPAPAASPPGFLRWRQREHRVDADLQSWPLEYTLERIAAETGWEILMEPGLQGRVAGRFTARPEREALATLLAEVNFALLPARDGSRRLLVFGSSTSKATRTVRPATPEAGTNTLDHELIVRLKPGSGESITNLAERLGGKVAGSVPSLSAHRLVFDSSAQAEAARAALASEEGIGAVEGNRPLNAVPSPDSVGGLASSASRPSLQARPVTGDGQVVVALLDTGLTSGVANADFLLPSVSVTGTSSAPAPGDLSHGAAMFETILQGLAMTQPSDQSQAVRVLPVDIYGSQQQASTFDLAMGIATALDQGANVLNLSLSGASPSPMVHELLQQAAAAGVLIFAAPGNEPSAAPTYPAAYPEVIAVTASDSAGQLASYANRGTFIDLIAPGTSVVPYEGDTWVVNGTSVSTAYAAGIAAGLLAETGRPASEILAQMRARMSFQSPVANTGSPAP